MASVYLDSTPHGAVPFQQRVLAGRVRWPSWRGLVPNGLTVARFVAGLMFPFVASGPRLALLLFAGVSDLIDGELSRRLHSASRFGDRFDPIADKAVVLAVAGTFLWEGRIEVWELILVVMRDLVVLGIAAVAALRHWSQPLETSPLVIGKITTAGQFLFLLCVLLMPGFFIPVFVLVSGLSCVAAIAYIYDAIGQRRNMERIDDGRRKFRGKFADSQ